MCQLIIRNIFLSQVRQRPPSAHAAMDTMYSQGRPWWSGQSSCHLDVIKMWYYVVALLVYQKFRTHATIWHHPFSPSFKTVPLSPLNEICVFFWTVLPNHSKLCIHRAMLLHKQISSVIKKALNFRKYIRKVSLKKNFIFSWYHVLEIK